jgi:WXG100 family type VII secretion target
MTSAFNTETATMAQASSHVTDVNSQISSELSSLESAVEAVQAYWTGAGASSFQQLMSKWNEDSKKLNTALSNIADQIGQSGKAYQSQDDAANQAIKSAGSGLNM